MPRSHVDDGVAAVERLTRYANEAVAGADLKDVVASGHQRIERTIIDGNAANTCRLPTTPCGVVSRTTS